MKLQQQVSTLAQSKRLKELGVAQGFSSWSHLHLPETKYRKEAQIIYTGDKHFTDIGEENSAFDVAELGVMLPNWIYRNDNEYRIDSWRNSEDQYEEEDTERSIGYFIEYRELVTRKPFKELKAFGETEAESRAAMLIHLLENNLINVADVNHRLIA